jgi:predicted double-glycine peptidase
MSRIIASLAGSAMLLLSSAAWADQVINLPGNTNIRAPVTSYVALRFDKIVKQGYDVSCGAAALATLLTHYYGMKVGEKELIDRAFAAASDEDKQKINAYGFSMLELKHLGEGFGFQAGGFRIDDVEKLAKLTIPALTLITIRGYAHFVVLKGVYNGQVYIADPAFGNRSRPIHRFAEEWDGVILLLVNDSIKGSHDFSPEESLRGRPQDVIPLIDRYGGPYTPGTGEF